jgi:Helix-turn-helix.
MEQAFPKCGVFLQGESMDLQVISRDGEPEYAVLPWAQYQALLKAAGFAEKPRPETAQPAPEVAEHPAFDQLGALRTAKCLEVATLARAVGISPSYLELIENGTREPDAAIKRSLAWELGVPGWRGES